MGIVISVLFIIVCVLLILVVLLQKGRGGGLGAALGGAGSAAFGTKVGDFMTWVTIVLTSLFLLLAILSALYFRPPEATAAEPRFLPGPQATIAEEIRVTIEYAEGDKVFYTVDGTVPDNKGSGDLYKNAIDVFPGMVLKAIAYPPRGKPSKVVEASYRAPQPYPPTITPLPNPQAPITGPTEVTIEAGSKSDKVYFTTDDSEPTESSRPYTGPITVQPKMTLKVRAFAPHAKASEVVVNTYGLKGETLPPVIIPPTSRPATSMPATAPAAVGAGQ